MNHGFKVVDDRTGLLFEEDNYYIHIKTGRLCKNHKVKGLVYADKFLKAPWALGKLDSQKNMIYDCDVVKWSHRHWTNGRAIYGVVNYCNAGYVISMINIPDWYKKETVGNACLGFYFPEGQQFEWDELTIIGNRYEEKFREAQDATNSK